LDCRLLPARLCGRPAKDSRDKMVLTILSRNNDRP
jgi:hypothetical protein